MTKEEITLKGLEIVAHAGEARSNYLMALKFLTAKEHEKANTKIEEGNKALLDAHQIQTDLMREEAKQNYSDITITMIHGQDHLMTTILLRELIEFFLKQLFVKVNNLETEITELKKQTSENKEKGIFKKWKNI